MRRLYVAALVLLATLGHSRARATEKQEPYTDWTLAVTDSQGEVHNYQFDPGGGPIKVDVGDWKCSYHEVRVSDFRGVQTETTALDCTAGKYNVVTPFTCIRLKSRIPQLASLAVGTAKKQDLITISCDPL